VTRGLIYSLWYNRNTNSRGVIRSENTRTFLLFGRLICLQWWILCLDNMYHKYITIIQENNCPAIRKNFMEFLIFKYITVITLTTPIFLMNTRDTLRHDKSKDILCVCHQSSYIKIVISDLCTLWQSVGETWYC
jgi:hypothetical protein